MNIIVKATNRLHRRLRREFRIRQNCKIFCIGRNKTGTTSLKQAFLDLGYVVGNQARAEMLIHAWAKRDFRPIIKYCRSAEVFQDVPFSRPYTFQALDHAYPGSKFILTVRGSADEWYQSLIRYHSAKFGLHGRIPTKEDLMNATYRYKGWMWESNRSLSITPEDDLYNADLLKKSYIIHNENVIDYFKHRKEDLWVINVSESSSYKMLCEFMGEAPRYDRFPWKNRSR